MTTTKQKPDLAVGRLRERGAFGDFDLIAPDDLAQSLPDSDVRLRALVGAFRARWSQVTREPLPSPAALARLFAVHGEVPLIALQQFIERRTTSVVSFDEISRWLHARAQAAFVVAQSELEPVIGGGS